MAHRHHAGAHALYYTDEPSSLLYSTALSANTAVAINTGTASLTITARGAGHQMNTATASLIITARTTAGAVRQISSQ